MKDAVVLIQRKKLVVRLSLGLLSVLTLAGCSWFSAEPSRVENPVVRGVDYVGMTVSNLERSSVLYQKAADLTPSDITQIDSHPVVNSLVGRDGAKAKSRLLTSVNAQLKLTEFTQPAAKAANTPHLEVYGPGIAHVCYQVAKHTHTYETFLANGATPIGDPEMIHLNPKNPVYYAYAHDPDHILFEVEHVDVQALELPTPPKNEYRIRHVSLATTDMDRSVDFYSHLLETKDPRRAGSLIKLSGEKLDKIAGQKDAAIEMAWFQIRNLELEIIQYHSPQPAPLNTPRPFDALGYNSVVFDVTDLAAAKALLLEAGGTLVSDARPMDGGYIMYGRDLDGNLLGFQKSADGSPYSSQQFADNGI